LNIIVYPPNELGVRGSAVETPPDESGGIGFRKRPYFNDL
jgi:hypothetical protein